MREPAGLAHVRIAVEKHEGRRAEAVEKRLQPGGIGKRQEEVGVAEAGVNLYGKLPCSFIGLERVPDQQVEQRLRGETPRLEPQRLGGGGFVGRSHVEPTPVGDDRLQRHEAVLPRRSHALAHVLTQRLERLVEGLLRDPLDPQHRQRGAACDLAHLLSAERHRLRRETVVEQQQVSPGRTQERRRVLARVACEPVLPHCPLICLAAEERRQPRDRAVVHQARGDMRPLRRVWALGEEAAELVQRHGRLTVDGVRVVVDEPDRAQYFEKWPSSSNASSSVE